MFMVTKRAKLLAAIKNNPKAVRPEDLFKLLSDEGWEEAASAGSSHRVFRKAGVGMLCIPYKRPHLKPQYVREALAALGEE